MIVSTVVAVDGLYDHTDFYIVAGGSEPHPLRGDFLQPG